MLYNLTRHFFCVVGYSLNNFSDISIMSRTVDLSGRGEITTLVKTLDADISNEDEQEYTAIVDVEPLIQTYCEVYADDLEQRIGIDVDARLPTALGMATLLNPMFGLRPKVTRTGLMNEEQYENA